MIFLNEHNYYGVFYMEYNIIFLDNSNKGFTQNIGCIYDPETDGVISMHFPFNKITCVVNLIITSI